MTERQKDRVSLVILCTLAIACWLPRLHGPIDLRWDGGAYYILGTSLAEGKGYRLLSEPGEINSTLHPPLLPVLVAVHQRLLGTSDPMIVGQWLRRSFCVMFLLYVIAAYSMLRISLTAAPALLATVICLLHFNTQFLSDLLFAELLFALITTFFYVCFRRRAGTPLALLAVPLALASYALRTVGVALLAAWVADAMFRKDFKTSLFRIALSLVPILAWQVYVHSVESSPAYHSPAYEYQRADYVYPNVSYLRNTSLVDSFAPEQGYVTARLRVRRFAGNVLLIPAKLGSAISTVENYWVSHLSQLSNFLKLPLVGSLVRESVFAGLSLLGFLVIGGSLILITRGEWFIPCYLATYLVLLCSTPWPGQYERYLMPLAPFLVLCLFEALRFIERWSAGIEMWRWRSAGRVFMFATLGTIVVMQVVTVHAMYSDGLQPVSYHDRQQRNVAYRQFYYSGASQDLDEALDWLMVHGTPGHVVAGSWPHWIYLRTGFKAVLPPFELDPARAQRLLDTVPVKYLVLSVAEDVLGINKYVVPVLEQEPGQWIRIFATRNGKTEIYEER